MVNVLDDLLDSGCAPPGAEDSKAASTDLVVCSAHRITLRSAFLCRAVQLPYQVVAVAVPVRRPILGDTDVEGAGAGGVVTNPHHLWYQFWKSVLRPDETKLECLDKQMLISLVKDGPLPQFNTEAEIMIWGYFAQAG